MSAREDFVRAYAERAGLSDEYALLGFIDVAGRILIALPCACGDDTCEGWAMVGPDSVTSHLELYAPEPIRTAFRSLSTPTEGE